MQHLPAAAFLVLNHILASTHGSMSRAGRGVMSRSTFQDSVVERQSLEVRVANVLRVVKAHAWSS